MFTLTHRFNKIFLLLSLCIFIFPQNLFSQKNDPVYELSQGWEYRYGDSPFDTEGVPLWSYDTAESYGWNASRSLYNIAGRNAQNFLWLRVKIPDGRWPEAVAHIKTVDQCFEVYVNQKKIYSYGSRSSNFSGFGSHLVALPKYADNTYIYFRIYSGHNRIGILHSSISIGNRADIISDIAKADIDKFVLGVLFIMIGLAACIIFAAQFRQVIFLAFSAFCLSLGMYTIARTELKQFLLGNSYQLWGMTEILALYMIPFAITSFCMLILKPAKYQPLRWMWHLSAVYGIGSVILAAVRPNLLMLMLTPFEAFLLITILVTIVHSVIALMRGNTEAQIFTLGAAIFGACGIFDILQEMSIIHRAFFVTHWGIFIFIACLTYILGRRIVLIYQNMQIYSAELEQKNFFIKEAHDEMENLYQEIELTQKEVIFRLSEVAEARSKETGNHVRRVAEYARLLAVSSGLSSQEVDILKLATPMHDIGKLGIPDAILHKPDKLTPDEFDIIKTHTHIGHEMMRKSERPIFSAASIVAYEHHERFDGKGYPRGLAGNDIHIYGRITAIADVFDSLASDRCYKKAWELDRILSFMEQERGKQFDPDILAHFFKNIENMLVIRDLYQDV